MGGRMVLLLEALEFVGRLPKIFLVTSMAHSLGLCITPARFLSARRLPGCLSRLALSETDTMVSEALLLDISVDCTLAGRKHISYRHEKVFTPEHEVGKLPFHPSLPTNLASFRA